jgi:hypothetical protein
MKRSELKLGSIYKCQFSGFKMIISRIEKDKTQEGKETLVVFGRYFNNVTGKFEETYINDGQLGLTSEHIKEQKRKKYRKNL